jgi:uncharacterized protein DUF4185
VTFRSRYTLGIILAVAAVSSLPAWADDDEHGSRELTIHLINPGYSNLRCRVSNTSKGGLDHLDTLFEMGAADQGTSIDDREHRVTWFLFGDTADSQCEGPDKADCIGDAWYGSNGANAIGYLSGRSYGDPDGLCGSMKVLTQPGLVSASGGACFAPDLQHAAAGDGITNYLFQSPTPPAALPDNAQVLPVIPANGAISGTNEGPTSGFMYRGQLFAFYAGGPGLGINSDCTVGLAKKSVSYLAVWEHPSIPEARGYQPPDYRVLSRMDYDLEDFTVNQGYETTKACARTSCSGAKAPVEVYRNDGSGLADCQCVGPAGTGLTCSQSDPGFVPQTVPGDWRAAPPMGGHFVWVTAVVHDEFLYLFGTGQFRRSPVFLARLPVHQRGADFPDFVPHYFADTPGLEFYDANRPRPWSADPAEATPLSFDGDPNGDIGEVSVRYFDEVGAWLMSYSRPSGHGGGQRVIVRWAESPVGLWHEMVSLDMSVPVNQCLYCQNADATACNALGVSVPSPEAFTNCFPDSLYAPDMLPYLTHVHSKEAEHRHVVDFTVSYLFSTFQPYDSVLFTMDLEAVSRSDEGRPPHGGSKR